MTPAEAEEFHVYQYLVAAEPEPPADYGLTSIVLVTRDRLGDVRRCLEGVRRFTDEPYELVVVDNASTDGTPDYLRSLGGEHLIANPDDRGFAAAIGQGVSAARGSQILLLDVGTAVTTGWLRRLLEALHSDPAVGLAGPCSDGALGAQRAEADYDPDGLDGFAWEWGKRWSGVRDGSETLGGFCLLVRRDVCDAIGVADERSGAAGATGADWCGRARQAGFRAVVARDAFVRYCGLPAADDRRAVDASPPVGVASAGGPHGGLTSIVILTHNQLEFTRGCVESLRRSTPERHELVFVDNASTDGTLEYLRSVPGATVIANAENRGFPAAANQGIAASTGRQVLLLNNDTVVPAGWLGRLLRVLAEDPAVGLVGPCSNCVSGEQQIPADYQDLEGLEEFAALHAARHAGVREPTDRLVGFCLLVRREVIDQVGLLDERFGVGCYEDDDYCRRASAAGWKAVIARDAYVHHYGGRTFVGDGVDFAALMRVNRAKYEAKWDPQPVAPPRATPPTPALALTAVRRNEGEGLWLERKEIVLSLCMIARDNAHTIAAALEGIRPWVDEMVVVDTGSSDETPAICAGLGARVGHFAWADDFSAARNESLRLARGRWLFWMDSDDVIDPDCGRRLRELAYAASDPSVLGYVVQVRCPGPAGSGNVTVVDHVKLVRNHPGVRFELRVHEQVLPAIRRLGGEVAWTDLFVTHAGYDHSPAGQARKLERDLRLLHLDLGERPEHPFVLFNLGMTYADAGRPAEAAGYLRRSIAASGSGESHLRKAYALLIGCYDRDGRWDEAFAACAEGLERFPIDTELRFRKGLLLYARGRLREAAEAYEDLLSRREERHFTSVAEGVGGFLARHNLALTYESLGEWRAAEAQWRRLTTERPDYEPGQQGLKEFMRRRRQNPAAVAT
jgi:GT2 family glycosyltransferase/tetratricopeptide (TPR) repeat protein